MLIRDLAKLSAAVYSVNACTSDMPQRASLSSWNGFQAASYMLDGHLVVAFRGTAVAGDLVDDITLGVGANSAYFSMGEQFVQQVMAYKGRPVNVVCGHSLGGAIAQVVGNRLGIPMVSFNAPGVAVLASRNIGDASRAATMIRVSGMVASALVRPGQALSDIGATFREVRGLNIRLDADPVSRIGIHYGRVTMVAHSSTEDLTRLGIITPDMSIKDRIVARHSIDTVVRLMEEFRYSEGGLSAVF